MWGAEPAACAFRASEIFSSNGYRQILIPGIGYGRNAAPFLQAGMQVVGIEISQTAIGMAREKWASNLPIFHGSVTDMPFDDRQYEGIFSFALIHLLDEKQRQKFIADCYNQLVPGGTMIFVTIAETAPMFGTGKKMSDRVYETRPGVRLFFYDQASVDTEFARYGLKQCYSVSEPAKQGQPGLDFLWIECVKAA